MNRERMTWLREVVETTPESAIDLSTWLNKGGTRRCYAGWLCADPRAQEAGLKTKAYYGTPLFEDEIGLWALPKFLDIDIIQTEVIFLQWASGAPKEATLRGIDAALAET